MTEQTAIKNKYEIDMCSGPLFSKILIFTIPVMLSGLLQLLFNAADIIVVGRFAGNEALAAVGSTGSLINFLVNVFIGLSVGVNVLVARFRGSGQLKELNSTVHTAIATSLISGCILIIIGLILSEPLLKLMGTPTDVIELSVLYMRIYFCGMPAMMAYNFGAAILRAVGDTKRPLYYLLFSGILNVVLNLIFVILFKMSVAGVALATIISQILSAYLILRCLIKTDSDYKLVLKQLRIDKDKLFKMIQIGVPAGLQGALFSVSNMLIQSTINSFGSVAMAGNTAAGNLEGFIYTAMNAFHQASISFTSQNYGAMKYKRIMKILFVCMGLVSVLGFVMGVLMYLFADKILLLYSSDPKVIDYGIVRLGVFGFTYFTCGIMETIVGSLRGMGHSVIPMLVSLAGACGMRILWVVAIFPLNPTLLFLYWSYPISWVLTSLAHFVCFLIFYRRLFDKRQIQYI